MQEEKRLTMRVPEDLHTRVKVAAAFRGVSITVFMMQAIIEKLVREEQFQK